MPTGQYVRTKYHKAILELSRVKAVSISAELRRGKKLSEEHRKKISNAYEYEKYNPKEKGLKISKALTGRKVSEEARIKMSLAKIGKPFPYMSPEAIERGRVNRLGEKHWRWKGGRTELVKQIKNLFQYKEWRRHIFKRDNYTCVLCNCPSSSFKNRKFGTLNADHIKPFSVILTEYNIKSQNDAISCLELWDINNGRTLCKPCHHKTDTYGGKINRKKI